MAQSDAGYVASELITVVTMAKPLEKKLSNMSDLRLHPTFYNWST